MAGLSGRQRAALTGPGVMAIRRCFLRNDGLSIAAYQLFADNDAGRNPQRQNSVTIFPKVFVLLFFLLVEVSLKT
jgi:hypothetical protein